MRKIQEVLRPSAQRKSVRELSRATGVSRPSVATYLEKATEHQGVILAVVAGALRVKAASRPLEISLDRHEPLA